MKLQERIIPFFFFFERKFKFRNLFEINNHYVNEEELSLEKLLVSNSENLKGRTIIRRGIKETSFSSPSHS